MNSILAKIESIDSFDELANLLQSKDLIKEVHDFFQKLQNPRHLHSPDDPSDEPSGTPAKTKNIQNHQCQR